jgi:hypothetical protein
MTAATAVLSSLMVLIGVAMIAVTLTRGGGPLAFGLLVGILFIAAGGGRLWAQRHR